MSSMAKKDAYDSLASVLNSIDNITDKMLEYQRDKFGLSDILARTIDKTMRDLEIMEINEKYYHSSAERSSKARKIDLQTDAKDTKNTKPSDIEIETLDTAAILKGIRSSPSGLTKDFVSQSIRYLRQKDTEKRKKLTRQLISGVRDSLIIRVDDDASIWDRHILRLFEVLLILSRNVNVAFKGKDKDDEGETNKHALTDEEKEMEREGTLAREFRIN